MIRQDDKGSGCNNDNAEEGDDTEEHMGGGGGRRGAWGERGKEGMGSN